MTQGLGIGEIINIDTKISSGGIGPADFGTGLLLVADDALNAWGAGKIQRFDRFEAVEEVFENNTIRQEASVWFAADPSPKALYIARVVPIGVPTEGYSKTISDDDRDDINDKSDWTIKIQNHNLTGIDPDSSSGDAIATAIELKLRAADTTLAGSDVDWDDTTKRFKFVLKGAGSNTPVTDPLEIENGSSASSNLAPLLGFTDLPEGGAVGEGKLGSPGAFYRQGRNAQGVAEALTEVIEYASSGRPTNIMLSDTVPTTITAGGVSGGSIASLRAFAQGGDYITAFVDKNKGALFGANDVVTPTSQPGIAAGAQQGHVISIYSEPSGGTEENRRVDIAVLAKLSSQDFNQPQSIVTLVPKPLQGVVPSSVTPSQLQGLEDANVSVYTTVGGYPSFLGGKAANGTWADAQYWLAWLKNEMELNIYNAMRQSSRFDNIELTDTIHKVMAKAINSGGVKIGGIVNTAMKKEIRLVTQNPGFNGILQNGYLMYIQPYSSLTDIDRQSRHQSFKVWIAPSDAIHSVGGTIVLSG